MHVSHAQSLESTPIVLSQLCHKAVRTRLRALTRYNNIILQCTARACIILHYYYIIYTVQPCPIRPASRSPCIQNRRVSRQPPERARLRVHHVRGGFLPENGRPVHIFGDGRAVHQQQRGRGLAEEEMERWPSHPAGDRRGLRKRRRQRRRRRRRR